MGWSLGFATVYCVYLTVFVYSHAWVLFVTLSLTLQGVPDTQVAHARGERGRHTAWEDKVVHILAAPLAQHVLYFPHNFSMLPPVKGCSRSQLLLTLRSLPQGSPC